MEKLENKPKLIDLINFDKVNVLLDNFNKATGFVTAILDEEGNVLSKSGWRQICTKFHRENTESAKKCTESDLMLSGKLAEGHNYHCHNCLNGLVDAAVPIIINGEFVGNLFTGQFFLEKPDREFFRKQALKYGFEEKTYLEALDEVPIVSESQVNQVMNFLLSMTEIISEMTQQSFEQKMLNDSLKESEEKFRNIFEFSPLGKSLTGIDGSLKINKAFSDMLGYSIEDLQLKTWQEITYSDDIQKSSDVVQSLIDGKTNKAQFEKRYIHKNGSIIWTDVVSSLKRDKNNNPEFFLTTIQDITERKQSENKIKRFSRIFEDSLNEIYIFDGETMNFTQVNTAAQQNLGYTMEEFQKMTPLDFKPELTSESFAKLVEPLRKGEKEKIVFETVHQRKDKSLYNVEVHLQLLHFDNESMFVAIILDITERKQAEKELKESEKRYRALLLNLEAGIIVHAPDTSIVMNNPRASELLGLSNEQMIGKEAIDPAWKFVNENNISLALEDYPVNKINSSKQPILNQVLGVSRPNTNDIVWLTVNGFPALNNKGNITEIVISFIDITNRKKNEEELLKHRDNLEKMVAERTKELEDKNKELDNALKVFVGREMTIKKLQERIRALGGKL